MRNPYNSDTQKCRYGAKLGREKIKDKIFNIYTSFIIMNTKFN